MEKKDRYFVILQYLSQHSVSHRPLTTTIRQRSFSEQIHIFFFLSQSALLNLQPANYCEAFIVKHLQLPVALATNDSECWIRGAEEYVYLKVKNILVLFLVSSLF